MVVAWVLAGVHSADGVASSMCRLCACWWGSKPTKHARLCRLPIGCVQARCQAMCHAPIKPFSPHVPMANA